MIQKPALRVASEIKVVGYVQVCEKCLLALDEGCYVFTCVCLFIAFVQRLQLTHEGRSESSEPLCSILLQFFYYLYISKMHLPCIVMWLCCGCDVIVIYDVIQHENRTHLSHDSSPMFVFMLCDVINYNDVISAADSCELVKNVRLTDIYTHCVSNKTSPSLYLFSLNQFCQFLAEIYARKFGTNTNAQATTSRFICLYCTV